METKNIIKNKQTLFNQLGGACYGIATGYVIAGDSATASWAFLIAIILIITTTKDMKEEESLRYIGELLRGVGFVFVGWLVLLPFAPINSSIASVVGSLIMGGLFIWFSQLLIVPENDEKR